MRPFLIDNDQPNSSETIEGLPNFNFDKMDIVIGGGPTYDATEPPVAKKPKKKGSLVGVVSSDGTDDKKSKRELNIMETTEPFRNSYMETDAILRTAITQLDSGIIDVSKDISLLRNSKTIKNKYQYLSLLQGSLSNFLSNKIAAARELNNTITKCNDFEMRRYKETRLAAAAEAKDDDVKIMEMYKAFVNTPVNSGITNSIGPSVTDMTIPSAGIVGNDIGSLDTQYQSYIDNLTPQQNMMRLENNPNIKQVVVYNQENGARWFDVIDMTTGQSIPNVEKHDAMFLEDVTLDLKNNVARNVNLGETYPLVIVGQSITSEY